MTTINGPAEHYRDTIDWLFGLQFVGIKLGLERMRAMAAGWGNPQRAYEVVHVAGTNGKGSTSSFIAAGLQAAGYRVGLYTSPHLVDFRERIRVNGVMIGQEDVLRMAAALRPEVEARNATFFEATTLMAFRHFAEQGVDIAVVETGLGGRLDATNIVRPACSVITPLSLDHTEFLGPTLASIAWEKAGIIKSGRPVLSAAQDEQAMRVLRWRAAAEATRLTAVNSGALHTIEEDATGSLCRLPAFDEAVRIGLPGRHQLGNAALAADTLLCLRAQGWEKVDEAAMRAGLRDVRHFTGLMGRLQRLREHPELFIDVGHNVQGLAVLFETWRRLRRPERTHVMFGVQRTKDVSTMLREIAAQGFASVTLVQARAHEAYAVDDLLRAAMAVGIDAHTVPSVVEGVRDTMGRAGTDSVLVFGSHYVVGEFLRDAESV